MSKTVDIWKRTASPGAQARYRDLKENFEVLQKNGYLPREAKRVIDVGSGSGGGSLALTDLFPHALITAVDNASTQQDDSRYQLEKLPGWTSIIEFYPHDIRDFAPTLKPHDVVVASRLPFSDRWHPTWRRACLHAAEMLITLSLLSEPEKGVVLVGYERQEDPDTLPVLHASLRFGELFRSSRIASVRRGDDWLVLSQMNSVVFRAARADPDVLLTDYGKTERRFSLRGLNDDS